MEAQIHLPDNMGLSQRWFWSQSNKIEAEKSGILESLREKREDATPEHQLKAKK